MKTLAIIIPAYDCAEFIPDLVAGIRAQYSTPGWRYEWRIGCDHCEKTSAALRKLKVPHYQAVKNVGHAIMRNALIALGPADAFAYFDADDKMMPAYLKRNIKALKMFDIVLGAKLNTDINLRPKTGKPVVENGGAMSFTKRLIDCVGGFAPYRCAIDTDLMRRAEMAGFVIGHVNDALYYRRGHSKALTKTKKTGMGSPYRKKAWAEMTAARKRGIIKIEPVTVKLEEVR